MLERFLKMYGALCTGIGVTFLSQVIFPPTFLHVYGMERYGEWLVLSAAMSYLQTINFGITTYASNELTILHQRGDSEQYRALQASTLIMVVGILLLGTLICSSFFLLPLNRMLNLKILSATEAHRVAFLFGMQTVVSITSGYYGNLFMVVGKAHRGVNWNNAKRLAPVPGALPLICLHASFAEVALGQFVVMLLISILSILDLKRCMGDLPMGIGGARWSVVRSSLFPSALFGLANLQYLLVYQGPVIVLQWVLGPAQVVVFSIGRTILSIARQQLTVLTDALKPEITMLWAARDMKKLLSLFHNSERVMYFAIPTINMGTWLFAPLILRLWIHRDGLFDVYIYGLLAVISCAISMREHKQFFHFSTNTHHRYAVIVSVGNIFMVVASIPATMKLGVHGLLYVWLLSELAQMLMIYSENRRLFARDPSITIGPAFRLILMMGASFAFCSGLLLAVQGRALWQMCVAGCVGTALVGVASYYLFGVYRVRALLAGRLRGRLPAWLPGV